MRIVICPSNTEFMPYVSNYRDELFGAKFLIWDRFDGEFAGEIEYGQSISYTDGKSGHRRNFFDYLKFSFWVSQWVVKNSKPGDLCLIFSFQLLFYLWPLLVSKGLRYLIDIRDYHFIWKFIPRFVFTKAEFVAISSPGYSRYLPKTSKWVVSHNYIPPASAPRERRFAGIPRVISCIGAIGDFNANAFLIEKLCNKPNFVLRFHGHGQAANQLHILVKELDAKNVMFTGFYNKSEEPRLYMNSSMINLLMDERNANSQYALANRLYNAAFFGVPLLCFDGSLTAEYIKKYNLGVCIEGSGDLVRSIDRYFEHFDMLKYQLGVRRFLEDVSNEQSVFRSAAHDFFSE